MGQYTHPVLRQNLHFFKWLPNDSHVSNSREILDNKIQRYNL